MSQVTIPRILHTMWLGDTEPTEFARHCWRTWQERHPGWETRTWRRHNLPPLRRQALYEARANTGHRADVLRYELMYRFGGVYVDADLECVQSIEALLPGRSALAGAARYWDGDDSEVPTVEIALLGSRPEHPLFDLALDLLPAWYEGHAAASSDLATGPHFFSDVVLKWRGRRPSFYEDLAILPPPYFFPWAEEIQAQRAGQRADVYAVHHWTGSWR